MSKFLISDFHFSHSNICGPTLSQWSTGYRNFSSIEEMNDTIIDNTNSKVGVADELYFLGDFNFGDKKKTPELRERIRCRYIHFIYGNHDSHIRKYYKNLFSTTQDYLEFYHNKTLVCMFHYPMLSWHQIGRGSVHCFGHCHGNLKSPHGRSMDIGVDTNAFIPYKLDDVVERLLSLPIHSLDHHQGEE